MALEVLYEDRDLIAIHKPSGLLVHRTALDARETIFALQLLRDQIGAHVFPVHRLDKPTSGVLLFAKSSPIAARVGLQFQNQDVDKTYLAIVRGAPHPLPQIVDYPLSCEERGRTVEREALTHVELLSSAELPFAVDRYPTSRYSLVRARPKTGRKHQIRRHLRHIGSPIIGDVNHGVGKHNRFFREHFGCHRLLLACTELTLRHPSTGERLTLRASLSPEMRILFEKLGFHDHI